MKSSMNLKGDVKAGRITVEQALEKMSQIPEKEKTITYRRLKRGSIHKKVDLPKAEPTEESAEPKKKKSKKSKE